MIIIHIHTFLISKHHTIHNYWERADFIFPMIEHLVSLNNVNKIAFFFSYTFLEKTAVGKQSCASHVQHLNVIIERKLMRFNEKQYKNIFHTTIQYNFGEIDSGQLFRWISPLKRTDNDWAPWWKALCAHRVTICCRLRASSKYSLLKTPFSLCCVMRFPYYVFQSCWKPLCLLVGQWLMYAETRKSTCPNERFVVPIKTVRDVRISQQYHNRD